MMHAEDEFDYTEDDDVQVLGIPYKDFKSMMYIFLPKQKFALSEMEKDVNGQWILEHINNCISTKVNVCYRIL